MNGDDRSGRKGEEGERVSVLLSREVAARLVDFCREYRVPADRVVERALIEYFREGDVSH